MRNDDGKQMRGMLILLIAAQYFNVWKETISFKPWTTFWEQSLVGISWEGQFNLAGGAERGQIFAVYNRKVDLLPTLFSYRSRC